MAGETSNCKMLWNYMCNRLAGPKVTLIINKFNDLRIEY